MRSVQWTVDAQADLAHVDMFYADTAPEYANRLGDAAMAAAAFLAERPYAGPPVGDGQVRKWNVRTTPYILIYRVIEGSVEILRLRHGHENWRDE